MQPLMFSLPRQLNKCTRCLINFPVTKLRKFVWTNKMYFSVICTSASNLKIYNEMSQNVFLTCFFECVYICFYASIVFVVAMTQIWHETPFYVVFWSVSNQQLDMYCGKTRGMVSFGVACNCVLAEHTRCTGTVCQEVGVWRSDTFFSFCTTIESRVESQGISIFSTFTEKQLSEQGTLLYWAQVVQCSFSCENSWLLFTKQVRMCQNASNKCPFCPDFISVCFVPEQPSIIMQLQHIPYSVWIWIKVSVELDTFWLQIFFFILVTPNGWVCG